MTANSLKARLIVDRLLESDELETGGLPTPDPEEVVKATTDNLLDIKNSGVITLSAALNNSYFYHRTLKYKRSTEPLSVRRNGRTQTWKTRPGEFRIPAKYGLYEYLNITRQNANEWSIVPNPTNDPPPGFYGPPPAPEFFDI